MERTAGDGENNEAPVPGEFVCPGCGRPLNIVLRSTMCFAEAQVYCDECERDYQTGRGKWAERGPALRGVRLFPRRES